MKRSKPFAVIVDYEKHQALQRELNAKKIQNRLEAIDSLGAFHLGARTMPGSKVKRRYEDFFGRQYHLGYD